MLSHKSMETWGTLEKEESYDDIDYADYEINDYSGYDEEDGADIDDADSAVGDDYDYYDSNMDNADDSDAENNIGDVDAVSACDPAAVDPVEGLYGRRERTKRQETVAASALSDEIPNLYTCKIPIDTEEESRERYTRLKYQVLNGTPEEQKAAREEACLHMVGLVRKIIKKSYSTYVEKDPSYGNELINEAFCNIIKYLPKYNPEKGLPSTFFWFHINSALATTTTIVKHEMSSSDSALKRKIYKLREEYKRLGTELTAADVMLETGESMSKISAVMKMMSVNTNTHLEAIEEYDQRIAGDAEKNRSYESPEKLAIERITLSSIIKRGYEMFGYEEMNIYLRNKAGEESAQEIAESLGGKYNDDKIRRIIEKVQHGMDHDWRIRQLGAGYIRDDDIANDPFALPILPVDGQIDNMDLLDLLVV